MRRYRIQGEALPLTTDAVERPTVVPPGRYSRNVVSRTNPSAGARAGFAAADRVRRELEEQARVVAEIERRHAEFWKKGR